MRVVPPREWQTYEYYDSRQILVKLGAVEGRLAGLPIDSKVRSLRTRSLRPYNEKRQAALFCYGMSCLLGVPVSYAHVEGEDFDCVACWRIEETLHFCPIQLKELVPPNVNPHVALETELAKLKGRYADSRDLTVAVYLNRPLRLEAPPRLPEDLNLGALWVYGASRPDRSMLVMYGDLLSEPTMYEYAYPV
jgi:hypothetical protein